MKVAKHIILYHTARHVYVCVLDHRCTHTLVLESMS